MNPQTPLPPSPDNTVQLISFDIGIKHLAYCVLEYSPTAPTDQYEILEWKIINLLETETSHEHPPQSLCQIPMKPLSKKSPPKICSKTPKYQSPPFPPQKAIEYVCNKHATNHPTYLHPQHETHPLYTTTQLTKMDKPALQTYAQFLTEQLRKIVPDILFPPFPSTKKELTPYVKTLQSQIYLQPLLPPEPQLKANRANMVDLCKTLFEQLSILDTRFPYLQRVVIENQIGNIAARMMVIQGMITMFYTSRNRHILIEHVSSSHKLKYAATVVSSLPPPFSTIIFTSPSKPPVPQQQQQQPEESSTAPTKTKTAYQEHKAHAKEYCEAILESKSNTNPRFHHFWEEFRGNKKKKDDLADCFLQGIWSMGT